MELGYFLVGSESWSREFGPVVKMDRLMRNTIHPDETKGF